MKIALMSGAYRNAGDFLIEKRCRALIEHIVKDASIHRFLRKDIALSEKFEEINSMDAIVYTGGPIYAKDISHNGVFPTWEKTLEQIKPPIMIVGGGWCGWGRAVCLPYSIEFTKFSQIFF